MTEQQSPSSASSLPNDTFTIYNLRVEVICPPEKRILCGAKVGDYFTLEGEMLYLPPGQGISIYSLGTSLFLFLHVSTSEIMAISTRY